MLLSLLTAIQTSMTPASDVYNVGTLAEVVKSERQQATTLQVVLEGICRVRLTSFDTSRPFFNVAAEELTEIEPPIEESRTLMKHVTELASTFSESRNKLTNEVLDMVQRASDPGHLADLLATQLLSDTVKRQDLLEEVNPHERLVRVAGLIQSDLDIAALEQRIKDRVRDQIEKNQREYYLREQLKAIHDELGGEGGNEIDALRARRSPNAACRTISRRSCIARSPASNGCPASQPRRPLFAPTSTRLLSLPWSEQSEDRLDLDVAEQMLDEDHYGLEQVKERILEFLAVRKLRQQRGAGSARRQILCLAGPPGVGKTSLGRSIARAMGRKFVRVSLGGVRDEAEIRGHRRTYIGAMPGRIIQALKQAGTINPVILLDEIDKLVVGLSAATPPRRCWRCSTRSRTATSCDHYLDLPFDLSSVLFITTANYARTDPAPAARPHGDHRDRRLHRGREDRDRRSATCCRSSSTRTGCTHESARDHRQSPGSTSSATTPARPACASWTAIGRDSAARRARGRPGQGRASCGITESRLEELPRAAALRLRGQQLGGTQVGVAIGLGTTEIGGELIPVEVATMPGKGGLTITGQAGDVMQESAQAALSYARSRARAAEDRSRLPAEDGPAHPPAGGRAAEGRPLGRHHDGDRADLSAHQTARCAATRP